MPVASPLPRVNLRRICARAGVAWRRGTQDGYINIAANQQEQWESVCDVLGVPELKSDERFQKRDVRKANRKLLTPLLEEGLTTRPTAHWVDVLNKKGVPSGEILDLAAALSQPQIAHRGTIQTVTEPGLGDLRLFNLTAKFEKTPAWIDAPPPRLSADTDAILGGLGYAPEAIAALRQKGVV